MCVLDSPETRTLYVTLKARSAPTINHAIAAALLLAAAASSIQAGHHVLWATAEGLVALMLIVTVIRDFMRKRTTPPAEHVHDHLGWVEIISGLFLGVEAYTKTLGPHHVSFVVISFLPAIILVFLGVFESRVARRFYVRADATHLTSRIGSRSRFSAAWGDIARLEDSPRAILVQLTDGSSRRIPVGGLWRGDFVREWVMARAAEHGVGATAVEQDADPAAVNA